MLEAIIPLAHILPIHHHGYVLTSVALNCGDCDSEFDNTLVRAKASIVGDAMIHLRWSARCTLCGAAQRGEHEYQLAHGAVQLMATSWALGLDDFAAPPQPRAH